MKPVALSEGSWHLHTVLDQSPGLRSLADTLADLCDDGHPVVACTADLKYSNGLFRFQDRHPDRFFRREMGLHGEQLEVVFATITKAYKTLTNDAKRIDYDKEMREKGLLKDGVDGATHRIRSSGGPSFHFQAANG